MFRIYLPNYEHDLPAFFPSVINSKVNGQSWLPKFSYLTADNGLSHTINPSLSCLISFTMKNKMIWLISLIFIAELNTKAQTNPGFEEGLSGWEPTEQTAAVKIVAEGVYKGKASVRLGHKNAELIQRISLSPLCLFYYDTHIKASDKNTVGYSFVRFYDKNNHLLIEYKSKPVNDLAYQVSSYYTESPALTRYVTIGVEKSEGTGYIYVDDFSVKTRFGEPENKPQTLVNLDQYMKPFWNSDTIYNETVLLYSVSGQAANGRLLFQPDKIISVKSFHLKTEYTNGKDYDLTGNVFTRINNSDIPYRADTSFSHKDLAWFNIQSQWIVVTYTHHDKRRGVKPEYKGDDMPNTFAKLELKTPLTIVAYGMSITRGMNVSGYDIKAPFMPSYVDMFARALREKYHGEIRMYNAGLPGSKIDWGAEYTFNINATDVYIDTTQLHNYWVMEKNESWMNRKVGEVNSMSASAIISRGIEKPVVTLKKGDTIQPYILASKYPDGAIAVAAIGRTINRDHINPRADVLLKVENLSKPLGIFGYFNKLTIQLEKPSTFRQIFAQDLAGDQPVDVTHKILVKGDKVVIPGKLIDQIGLMYATKGDKSEPGLVLSFKK